MKKQLRALLFLFCLAGTALLPAQTPCHPDFDALMARYDANAACNVCNAYRVTCPAKTVAQ